MPIDSPLDGLAGIVSPFGSDGGSAPLIITATVSPGIGPLTDGDQVQDGLAASATDIANYASTAGTISSAVATVTIDGSPGTLTDVVSYNEEVAVSITVTDSAANERVFPAGAQTVAGIAPTVTASDSLASRTLTITVDSTTGVPSPTTTLTTLTLDGANVLGDETGSGPWDYVVPDDDASQTVAWEVTTTSVEGSDTASGSEAVAANLFAPTAAGGVADQNYTEDVAITPLDVSTDFTGTAPITYALAPSSAALPTGLSLSSAGELTGTPTTDSEQVNIVVRGTNAYGSDDTGFNITVQAAAETDPPVILTDSYDDGTKEITLEVEEVSWPVTTYWATVANPNTPAKTDIFNGTGDTTENGNFAFDLGEEVNTINVTDPSADEIHYYLVDNLGNETAIQIITGVTITAPADSFLLLESGDALLLENGDKLILET